MFNNERISVILHSKHITYSDDLRHFYLKNKKRLACSSNLIKNQNIIKTTNFAI